MNFIGHWFVYFLLTLCVVVGFVEIINVIFTILDSGLNGLGGASSDQVTFYGVLVVGAFLGTGIYTTTKA